MRMRSQWRFALSLALVALATAAATDYVLAQGAETAVTQKDIAFAPDKVSVKVGEPLVFVNQDPFGHNVYSESPGGEFDIGRQQNGQRLTVKFARPGVFEARCRIHPRMRLEITVAS